MDILAKWNSDLFKQLVYVAKVLVNEDILTVIFVSSEGLILPLVQKMSEVSRCLKIIDVGNISDETAINYLGNNGLQRELGEKIVQFTGGRFAYLVKCTIQYLAYSTQYPDTQYTVHCFRAKTTHMLQVRTQT